MFRVILILSFATSCCFFSLKAQNTGASANTSYYHLPPEGLRQTELLDVGDFRLIASMDDIWDATLGRWTHTDSFTYHYQGMSLSEKQHLLFSQGVWTPKHKEVYDYDAFGNRTLVVFQQLNGSVWENTSRIVYQYDANSNRTLAYTQNMVNGNWQDFNLSRYVYDANNNLTLLTRHKSQGNGWTPTFRDSFGYDGSNHRMVQIKQNWNTQRAAWDNNQMTQSAYTPTDKTESDVVYVWKNGAWEPNLNILYTYDAADLPKETVRQIWTGLAWINYSKDAYGRTGDKLTEFITCLWDNDKWTNTQKIDCGYDADGNKIYQAVSDYANGAWFYKNRSFSYYERVVSTLALSKEALHLDVFPNPSAGLFKVRAGSESDKPQTLMVFDATGHLVSTFKPSGLVQQVDLQQLPKGSYWLVVRSESGKWGTKLVHVLAHGE